MNKKKILLVALSIVLIVAISVAGTLAFVTANKAPITNTFVAGNQNIIHNNKFELVEHKPAVDANGNLALTSGQPTLGTSTADPGETVNYNGVFAGMTIPKDPKVTVDVEPGAVVYDFVKIEPTSLNNKLSYTPGDDWTAVDATNYPGVYVYNNGGTVLGPDSTTYELNEVPLLKDNKVTVASDAVFTPAAGETTVPLGSLAVSAYVCQAQSFANAAAAWAGCFA